LKNVQNETIKRLLVGNTKINISTNQGYAKSKEVRRILLLETAQSRLSKLPWGLRFFACNNYAIHNWPNDTVHF